MTGLKYLLNSLRMQKFVWISAAAFALLATLPYVASEPFGSEEYLYPKIALFLGPLAFELIVMTFLSVELNGNKAVRALPISRELFTRSLPILQIIISYVLPLALMGGYMAYLKARGCGEGEYSDTLIIGSVVCFLTLFVGKLFENISFGWLSVMYLVILPVIGAAGFLPQKLKSEGFNIPLGAAISVFALSFLLSSAFCFFVSKLNFTKSNVKILPMSG